MKNLLRLLFLLALPAVSQAQVGLATWNLAWMMDKSTHTRWVQACSAVGWKTDDQFKTAGLPVPESLRGLPYCDVHNGVVFSDDKKCVKAIGAALNSRPTDADTPDGKCRDAPDLVDWDKYAIKVQTLKETFAALAETGITVVGLQEVFDEAAVRQILPDGWDVKTSASLKGAPVIPQHVGVAWKKASHSVGNFDLLNELSAIGDRPLRPGFQFTIDLAGKPVDFLVVHLKSGCRSVPINSPKKPNEIASCPSLAQQVPVVERWIDARVGKDFVVMGDFNRSLLGELAQYPVPDPVTFGSTPIQNIRVMAPEWNDNQPKGSTVLVIPHEMTGGDKPKLKAGDYFCGRTKGIDHVILSAALATRIKPANGTLVMQGFGYRLNGKIVPHGKTSVPPSDHCARFVKFL